MASSRERGSSRLGLVVGRVLRRQPTTEDNLDEDIPDIVWECEYPDAKAREADVARLSASEEWDGIESHMQTLLRRFSRAILSR